MIVAAGFLIRIAFTLAGFLVSVLLARLLVPGELGSYFEALAWTNVALSVSQSGLGNFAVKEVSALRARGALGAMRGAIGTIHLVTLATSVVAAVALWIYSATGAPLDERRTYEIACFVIVALSVTSISQAVTRGLGRPIRGQVAENVVRPVVQLAVLATLFFGVSAWPHTADTIMAITLASALLAALCAAALELRSVARIAGGITRQAFRVRTVASSLTSNALIGWSMAINTTIGVIVLGQFDLQAGAATFRLMQQFAALIVFGQGVAGALLSWRLSDAHNRGDMVALRAATKALCNLSVLVALPLFLVFAAIGPRLIGVAFGSDYVGGYAVLIALALGNIANSMFAANTVLGISAGQERFTAGVHVVGAALNLVFCVALVPRFGAIGAAAAYAISYLVWNLWLFVALRRRTGIAAVAGPVAGERLVSLRHFWPAGA